MLVRALSVAVFLWLAPSGALAQTQLYQLGLSAASGVQLGPGQREVIATQRVPLTIDARLGMWSDEAPDLVWGGSLRAEVEGDVGVAAVPRVQLRQPGVDLELRPGLALPFYFAPFTMFGVETSLQARWAQSDGFGLFAFGALSVYFAGSDVPRDATVVMLFGGIGADIAR